MTDKSRFVEALKTGDPNRKVSDQEFLNVMCEAMDEMIAIVSETNKRLFAEDVVPVKVRPKGWLSRKLGRSSSEAIN